MIDKLKAWAHWASINPTSEDQKEMADNANKLIAALDELEEQVRYYKREFESALERIACLEQELEDTKEDSKRFRDLLDAMSIKTDGNS